MACYKAAKSAKRADPENGAILHRRILEATF
jgi:hypothetical protein